MQMMGPDCHSDEGRVGSLILKATPEFLTQVIMVSSLGIRFFIYFYFFLISFIVRTWDLLVLLLLKWMLVGGGPSCSSRLA